MTFFSREDPTEQLTQRNLKSPRANPTPQSQIIQKLQRENLYLRNQLFGLIQNSGVYDMYLPREALISQNYKKNDRMLGSPNRWEQQVIISHHKNEHYQFELSPRTQYFSPRVQSQANSNQLHQLGRARSPQPQQDFCRRLVINSNDLNRRTYRNSGPLNCLNTVRTSPAKLTPKESMIFTANPSPERNKSHFNDINTRRQAKEKVNTLKRNAKSPSFLRNKHAFKENVKESLSGVFKEIINQQSPQKQLQTCRINQQAQKDQNLPKKLEDIKRNECDDVTGSRRKSKTFTIQFSEGDSCLSIECRMREILYQSSRNTVNEH